MSLTQDLRTAVRGLGRHPVVTVVAAVNGRGFGPFSFAEYRDIRDGRPGWPAAWATNPTTGS